MCICICIYLCSPFITCAGLSGTPLDLMAGLTFCYLTKAIIIHSMPWCGIVYEKDL